MLALEKHWSLEAIHQHPDYLKTLQHPYLISFETSDLSKNHLTHCWLLQQAWLSRTFPLAVAALLAKTPPLLADECKALANIIRDEIWSSNCRSGHPKLFLSMYQQLEGEFSLEKLPMPLAGTKAFFEGRHQYLLNGSLAQGLGLLLCNEYINADLEGKRGIMVSYNLGLEKTLNAPVKYTYAHVLEESEDTQWFLKIIQKTLQTLPEQEHETFRQEVVAGCRHLLKLRINFFDALWNEVSHQHSASLNAS